MNPLDALSLRLVPEWQPGVWIGAMRRAFGPVAEVLPGSEDDPIESMPPQMLIALWPPQTLQQPFVRRWPAVVRLTGAPEAQAAQELLDTMPSHARLWIAEADVDWALLAEIVLFSDGDLAPWQQRELSQFIRDERRDVAQAIVTRYVGDEPPTGFAATQAEWL